MDTTLMNLSELHRMNCPSSSATAKAPTPPFFFEGAATFSESNKVKKVSTKTTKHSSRIPGNNFHFTFYHPIRVEEVVLQEGREKEEDRLSWHLPTLPRRSFSGL